MLSNPYPSPPSAPGGDTEWGKQLIGALHGVRKWISSVTPPEPLNLEESNLADGWRRWRQRFEVFSLGSGISEKDEKVQAATLLHVAGPEALHLPGKTKAIRKSREKSEQDSGEV